MGVQQQIDGYIESQPAAKAEQLRELHRLMLEIEPHARLWFLDGKDETGKIVSNPNIGYGTQDIRYADGSSKEFYRVGLSANTSGISIYVMGLNDRKYLAQTFAPKLGKASVTGYCVKFKTLDGLDGDVLADLLRFGLSDRAVAG